MSVKKSSDTVGNRTRDLPVCSAVPHQLRHQQRAPSKVCLGDLNKSYEVLASLMFGILTQDFKNILSLNRRDRWSKFLSKKPDLREFNACQLDSSLKVLRQFLKRTLIYKSTLKWTQPFLSVSTSFSYFLLKFNGLLVWPIYFSSCWHRESFKFWTRVMSHSISHCA
jgi:hypothetical protein